MRKETGCIEPSVAQEPVVTGHLITGPRQDRSDEAVHALTHALDLANERLALLQRLSRALAAAATTEQVADAIMTEGMTALRTSLGAICLLDPEANALTLLRTKGTVFELLPPYTQIPLDTPTGVVDTVHTGEPIFMETFAERCDRYPEMTSLLQIGSDGAGVALPLSTDARILGALWLSWPADRAFDADERGFMLTIAQICALALERVQTHEQERATLQHAEEALRDSEEKFRSLFENAAVPFGLTTPEGELILVNRVGSFVFGYSQEEMVPRNVLDIIHPEDRDLFDQSRRRLLTGEIDSYQMERRYVRKDGEILYGRSHVGIARDASGQPKYLVGIIEDLTEHHRMQKELIQAQKMEGIGRLAGGIAHDFNNLLAVILGYTELVEMELHENSPMRPNVQHIQAAATRAANLTRQLLAFARRQVSEPRLIDLNALIVQMSQMLQPLIGEDIELLTRPRATASIVRADPGQIEQVLLNLALNARDAMPDGGKLLLETDNAPYSEKHGQSGLAPGETIVIAVTDTGTGMTPDVKARLFEPFFTTKEVGKGTGLGLATCYGILKQNNGAIWAYSEPGLGSTFKIFLPCVTAPPEEASLPAPEPSRQADALQGSETVLVVEDEPLVRDLAVTALRAHGYTVLEAGNGVDALEIVASHSDKIDLLLTDVIMPQMGGQELAQRLKALHPQIRILFASGYSEEMFTAQGVLQPDAPLLPKPFVSSALLHKVRELLDA